MKRVNGYEIIQLFEQFSPKKFAVEGDKIGLQIGQLNRQIDKVIVALDVTIDVVNEAIAEGAQLIIAHHPLIYRPLQNVLTDTTQGQIIESLIRENIAVYVAHTNLDIAEGGVNDMLAEALQLEDTKVLAPTFLDRLKKLAVFVPEANEREVRQALGDCGAGAIGNYRHCSFTSTGTGRFLPEDGSDPHIGKQGKLEEVEEVKIEVVYNESIEKTVLKTLFKVHPYEEVAYDLYSLETGGKEYGLGRIGKLPSEMTLQQFANHVKESFQVEAVRVVGNLNDKINKVAVLGGDGNKYFRAAKFAGADVYVTGDIYYHTAHDAMMLDLNLVDPGHHVEQIMKEGVASKLTALAKENNYELEIIASQFKTEPFKFI